MPHLPHSPVERFLPTSREEMEALGWEQADVVFVSGDAYVDHPSFAAAILGRWLETHGFRVAILSQPDWRSADAWRKLGRPRLFYAVSAGAMDSMINHYTANRKRRNADAYSPGGRIGLRPDRPTGVYAQRCREAFKGVPVVTGGVEASLRRIAHYDYWSDKVLPSNLVASKADLLAFGMGERTILSIARRLDQGESVGDLRDLRGIAYMLGKTETLPEHRFTPDASGEATVELPSFEQVLDERDRFVEATRLAHRETNPLNARRMVQRHGDRTVVLNPPELALAESELDAVHELPYTREPHPRYRELGAIPAWQTIAESVQIMRGCFGGCSFCSITLHQGRAIQSRSPASVRREVETLAVRPGFKGHVSDLGGPTANMYRMRCKDAAVEAKCRRLSCVYPKVCKMLDTSHRPIIELMRSARSVRGIEKVHVASGIRMDLASGESEYLDELTRHHVGGHLKVAPEHVSEAVLKRMRKTSRDSFEDFANRFEAASQRAGKEQFLVPYFIASHPGSGIAEMIELAVYLKRRGYRPRQMQDFIPAPMDVATCMYYAGVDPISGERVDSARGARERGVQRALLQYFKPEYYFVVRRTLEDAGRRDLIGNGPDCLIPEHPPRAARGTRRRPAGPTRERARRDDDANGRAGSPGDRVGYRRAARERRRP